MNKNSTIFVAGGTGLVGSAIIKKLAEKGYSSILASSHTRKPDTQFLQLGVVRFISIDLMDGNAVSQFFANESIEYVFLAAAKVGGILANNIYRADFIYQNMQIQNNVIHESYKSGVKKLLFLGSSCIYPKEAPQPMKEEYLLTGPLEYTNEPYAIAKIAGLKMCESYNLQYGTNFISVMPTNLYGPHDNFDLETSHVLPALLRKMHEAKEHNRPTLEVWGSGNPRREFLYVDDLADACVFIMENVDFSHLVREKTEIRNTHINIGTGEDITIRELAQMIKEVVGYEGNLVFDTRKPDGTMQKVLDVSRLQGMGWKHTVSLKEGIEQTYRWYKETVC